MVGIHDVIAELELDVLDLNNDVVEIILAKRRIRCLGNGVLLSKGPPPGAALTHVCR